MLDNILAVDSGYEESCTWGAKNLSPSHTHPYAILNAILKRWIRVRLGPVDAVPFLEPGRMIEGGMNGERR